MLTNYIDKHFPKWAIVLLTIFGGASFIYRVMLFIDDCILKKEEKNVKALVWGILFAVIPVLNLIIWIVDIISVAKHGKIEKFR